MSRIHADRDNAFAVSLALLLQAECAELASKLLLIVGHDCDVVTTHLSRSTSSASERSSATIPEARTPSSLRRLS